MKLIKVVPFLPFLLGASFAVGFKQSLRGRLNLQDPCLVLIRNEAFQDQHEATSIACKLQVQDANEHGSLTLDLDETFNLEWAATHQVVSGETTMYAPGAEINGNQLEIPDVDMVQLETPSVTSTNRKLATTVSNRTVLVVRVVASDSEPTSDASTLSDKVFGTNGDQVNLASRFRECSFGKLVFSPTPHPSATNGVYTVKINQNAQSSTPKAIENSVTTQLELDLGGELRSQFDHVMYCLPKGTDGGNWVGFGYINYFLTVFNDKWCEYPSAQLHEVGHNLDLSHSAEGSLEYGDQSGVMGFAFSQDEGPITCFNAPKSWKLGWYSDRHDVVKPLYFTWSDRLVGISDYDRSLGYTVILKVEGIDSARDDYYVNFNLKSGRNSGTAEGGDQVLVTKRAKGDGYATSFLVGKLDAGGSFSTADSFGGETMTIRVNEIDWNASPVYAHIRVTSTALKLDSRPRATPPPTQSPSPLPTRAPTRPPSPSPTPPPTRSATLSPTLAPSLVPTPNPTKEPTLTPSPPPTRVSTMPPSQPPTRLPASPPMQPLTKAPSPNPTASPGKEPGRPPTLAPSSSPTSSPTSAPIAAPSVVPTNRPSLSPQPPPTRVRSPDSTPLPTGIPTVNPYPLPISFPTDSPMLHSTQRPTLVLSPSPTIGPMPPLSLPPTPLPTQSRTSHLPSTLDNSMSYKYSPAPWPTFACSSFSNENDCTKNCKWEKKDNLCISFEPRQSPHSPKQSPDTSPKPTPGCPR